MKTEIMTKAMTSAMGAFTKATMKCRKQSPAILLAFGCVGVVATITAACRATTKAGKIAEKKDEMVAVIHEAKENEVTAAGEAYTEEDYKKDITIAYVQTGMAYAKLYAPTVFLGVMSLTCILISHNIMRERNLALCAAYATINKSFKEYRSRVMAKYGEAVDHELKYGLKARKYVEIEKDPETGAETAVEKTSMVADPNLQSDYAVYFDRRSRNYESNMDYNRMFVKAQQQFANDMLRSHGHLFLNEVLDALDLPRTPAGQIVGWTINGPDGYVNFRVTDVDRELEDGSFEPTLLLDFNVEGDIWSKM